MDYLEVSCNLYDASIEMKTPVLLSISIQKNT